MAEPAVVLLQYNHNREAHTSTDHRVAVHTDHIVASQASALLQRFEAALCALLEAQETYKRCVETRWVALQDESKRVEAELAQLRISAGARYRVGGVHQAENTASVVDNWPQIGSLASAPSGSRRVNESRERDGHRQSDASVANEACRGDEPKALRPTMTSEAFPLGPRINLSLQQLANPEPADHGPRVLNNHAEAERVEVPREAQAERVEVPREAQAVEERGAISVAPPSNGNASNGTQKEETTVPRRSFKECLQRVVQSPHFDMLVGLVIVLNVIVMTIEVEYDGEMANPLDSNTLGVKEFETFFKVMEQFFTLVFFVELVARLLAFGWNYFKSAMNCLDACIVAVSCVDSWVFEPQSQENGSARHISLLRIVRLMRLMKVLRIVRVMKAFKPLRVLVTAVANSIGALLWSMTLLFVLQVIGAVILAQMLRPAIEDTERDLPLREDLWRNYGTMMRSLLTVFEITMAPGGFLQHRKLYDSVSPLACWVICVYVCFVTFAVTRVITAMFLKETLAASDTAEPERPGTELTRHSPIKHSPINDDAGK